MITFDVLHFFLRTWKRLLVVGALLMLFSLLSFLFFDDFELQNPSIWDHLISTFSHQFISLIFFPVLYTLLIADLVLHDLKENYAPFILARASSRVSWYLAKVSTLFYVAFLFVIVAVGMWLTAGLLKGLSWDTFSHPIFQHAGELGQSPFLLLALMLLFYIVGLTVAGAFVLWLSLQLENSILAWGGIVLLGLLSMAAFNANRALFIWLPLSQLMFKIHYPYDQLDPKLRSFTISWSGIYLVLWLLLSLIFGWLRVRRMNLSLKG